MSDENLQKILDRVQNREQMQIEESLDDVNKLLQAMQMHLQKQQGFLIKARQDYTSELSQFIYEADILQNAIGEEPAHKLTDRVIEYIKDAIKDIEKTLTITESMGKILSNPTMEFKSVFSTYPTKVNTNLCHTQDAFRRVQSMYRLLLSQIAVIPTASKRFIDNITDYARNLILRPEPDQQCTALDNLLTANLTTLIPPFQQEQFLGS